MDTVIGFLVLSVIVAIHEFGHYLAYRKYNVRVKIFSIGFFKLFEFYNYKGTKFVIGMLPLGGYVYADPEDVEKLKPSQHIFVSLAGPMLGLLATIPFVAAFAHLHEGLPIWKAILLAPIGLIFLSYKIFELLFIYLGPQIADSFLHIEKVKGLSGVSEMAKTTSLEEFVISFMVSSMAINLFNLIPVPPLDGGRALISGLEIVSGKPINPKFVNVVSIVVLLILMIPSLFGIGHEIFNYFIK
jgi:regulator of sigma E protease